MAPSLLDLEHHVGTIYLPKPGLLAETVSFSPAMGSGKVETERPPRGTPQGVYGTRRQNMFKGTEGCRREHAEKPICCAEKVEANSGRSQTLGPPANRDVSIALFSRA